MPRFFHMNNNRRNFLRQSSALAGGLFLSPAFSTHTFSFSGGLAPADQINVGAIKLPGVNVVALCDVDKNVLDKRMKDLADLKIDTSKIKTYGDYRRLLEQK